jgi:hypothetical protein
MDQGDPFGLQIRSDAANHGNLREKGGTSVMNYNEEDIERQHTAPDSILNPSVRSRCFAAKKVCLADSPEMTTTVFCAEAR